MENGPEGTPDVRIGRDNRWVAPLWLCAALGLGGALFTQFIGWWLGGFTWREGIVLGLAVGVLLSSMKAVKRDP